MNHRQRIHRTVIATKIGDGIWHILRNHLDLRHKTHNRLNDSLEHFES
jgi:hypothetical protein